MADIKAFRTGLQEGNPGLKRLREERAAAEAAEKARKEKESIEKEQFYQKNGYAMGEEPKQKSEESAEQPEETVSKPIQKAVLQKLESPVKKKKKQEEDYLLPSED